MIFFRLVTGPDDDDLVASQQMTSPGMVGKEQPVSSQKRDDGGLDIPGGPAGLGRGDSSLEQMQAAAVVEQVGHDPRRPGL
jgi:hypothetical protein